MLIKKSLVPSLTSLTVLAALSLSLQASAQVPAGYPADYAKIVESAKKEGKLVIYSATDSKAVEPLLKDFGTMYPGIKIEFNDMNSTEVYNRFISEAAAGGATADVLWSSAMDLQFKLVSEGYGASYKSQEAAAIPAWANYKDSAYGTTFEPLAIVYNKRLVQADEVPATHADLLKLLHSKTDKFRNKVTSYDIEKSGVGFLFITEDAKVNPQFWDLAKSFGDVAIRVQSSTGTMLERISSGENLIGYNVIGSYAQARAAKDPSIGVVFTKDYNLVLSRVVFINKAAKNMNASKLWIDYLLSKRGQTIIANESQLYSLRSDVSGPSTLASLTTQLGGSLKPIAITPALLQYLDQGKRLAFLKQWKDAAGKK